MPAESPEARAILASTRTSIVACGAQGDDGDGYRLDLTDDQITEARRLAQAISDRALGPARRPSEILRDALELIEDPARWLPRPSSGIDTTMYAFTPDMRHTWAGDPEAVCWCIGGALQVAGRAPASHMPSPPEPIPADWLRWEDTVEVSTPERRAAAVTAELHLARALGVHRVHIDDHDQHGRGVPSCDRVGRGGRGRMGGALTPQARGSTVDRVNKSAGAPALTGPRRGTDDRTVGTARTLPAWGGVVASSHSRCRRRL